MDDTSEGRLFAERYTVRDYPHLSIIDPRTGRLLWRKEGWTQEHPLTKEGFAEIAMDFCSRHSFDKPPKAIVDKASPVPSKIMTESEELQAAMRERANENSQQRREDLVSDQLSEETGPCGTFQQVSEQASVLDPELVVQMGQGHHTGEGDKKFRELCEQAHNEFKTYKLHSHNSSGYDDNKKKYELANSVIVKFLEMGGVFQRQRTRILPVANVFK